MDSTSDLQHEPSPTSTSTTTQECESNPRQFWIFFIILIAFSVIVICLYLFWRFYWKERNGKHLVLVKDVEKGDVEYAFDNPGFKEGTPLPQIKILNGSKGMKWTSPADKPVNNISNGKKPRCVDDSNLHLQNSQNTNVVPLKSRDFAGLGFNIYGNMRDGIFVKNILHHGPASESGKITTGDRISAVRINFSHIVYEDALAILTYASPYEIQVEVEKCQNWSFGSLKTDMKHSKDLSHPLYRSQSSSDLSQIQNNIFEQPATDRLFQNVSTNKPAVLQVSEISEKVPIKYDTQSHTVNTSNDDTKSSSSINNNVTVIIKNHNSKTQQNFDEVDLKNDDIIIQEQIIDQNKENNMKQKFVKGFQNIKDKINNHIQKDKKHKETTDIVYSNHNVDVKTQVKRNDSIGSNENDKTLSRSKKKAPPPPPVRSSSDPTKNDKEIGLIDEIENEINKYNFDSDSERDVDMNKKIELNSSQVTVHHIPEENRKSSSLGDLSKIADEDPSIAPLERAVSLELDDSISPGSKKRKAPLPPPEDIPDESPLPKELKVELAAEAKLKRASIFGTLEEAMKQDDEEDAVIISSTPIKNDDFISIGSNSSWELNFELQEPKDIVLVAGQDSTSVTPTKEYVTEITVADKADTGLFVTAIDESSIKHNHYFEPTESKTKAINGSNESSPDINHNKNFLVNEITSKEKKHLNSTPASREISPSKSPGSNTKSPKTKVPVSKIPVRANTEPTFKVAEKSKAKYLSNALHNGNGKINFSTYSISPNKSDIHSNGSIHEPSITHITVDTRK